MRITAPAGVCDPIKHRTSCCSRAGNRRVVGPARVANRANSESSSAVQHAQPRRSLLLAPLCFQSLAALLAAAGPSHADPEAAQLVEAPPAAVDAPPAAVDASPAIQFGRLSDPTLAYTFEYPLTTTSGRPLKMSLARAPEKYSSAAPLTADARQRIVSELLDFNNFVTISVTVGPASGVLQDVPPEEWKAKDVALTVLIDRSTSRMSTGQRFALNDVEEARQETRDGNLYWVYEHRSQGSPTINRPTAKETYRHALAVTSYRRAMSGEPYLYSVNFGCQEELWADLQGPFRAAVDSFRLTDVTDAYIPPDKDPWLFF